MRVEFAFPFCFVFFFGWEVGLFDVSTSRLGRCDCIGLAGSAGVVGV